MKNIKTFLKVNNEDLIYGQDILLMVKTQYSKGISLFKLA